jgi:hypothetical protein
MKLICQRTAIYFAVAATNDKPLTQNYEELFLNKHAIYQTSQAESF